MNILILTPEFRGFGGGIITYYRHLAAALARAGCRVHVIEGSAFVATKTKQRNDADGVTIETLEIARLARWHEKFQHLAPAPTCRRMLAAAWAMMELAQEAGPFDVVEATDFGLLAIPCLLQPFAPTVLQMHGSFGQIHVRDPAPGLEFDGALALGLETAAVASAQAVQSSSLANCLEWQQQSGRAVDCLRPAWASPRTAVAEEASRGISVFGRIQRWKGPQILCEALRHLPDCPRIDWYGKDIVLSASGSTQHWLQKTYPDVWGKKIRVNAPIAPSEVQNIQAQSLLNLIPSTWDVFNFTVVEAMASGRPVVCSNGAGASELIEEGVSGFIYEANAPMALAETLERALKTPPKTLRKMGKRAQDIVAQNLNPDDIAAGRISAYRKAISEPARNSPLPAWVHEIAAPRDAKSSPLSFLDQLPLRSLTSYVGARIGRKLFH